MQTIIENTINKNKSYLVRKSKMVLFGIIFKIIFELTLASFLVWAMHHFIKLVPDFKYVWLIVIYIIVIITYFSILISIIRYFYDVLIINKKEVYRIKIWLFLVEDIDVVDLYRVQEIKARMEWFIWVLLNIWDLHLVEQKDREKVVKLLDNPEKIAEIIKHIQEQLIKKRFNIEEEN